MLAKFFAPLAIKIGAGIILALLLALGFTWWGWNRAADARDEAKAALALAEAEIDLLKTDADLKDTAGVERNLDNAQVAQIEKEMIDAIRSVPDEMPGAVRVRFGCERLRRAGYLDSALPEVCLTGGS